MEKRPGEIRCPLRAAALAAPDATAVLGVGRAVSYAELDLRVSSAAAWLSEKGCGPGVRVALYLPQDERYIVLLLALLRVGAVSVPLSTRLPAAGVFRLLRKSGCPVLVSEDGEILENLPRKIVGLSPGALPGPPEERPGEPGLLSLERPATIIFTSGSTGGPKAALHTLGNHYYSALGSNGNIGLRPGNRWLLSLPLYHVGGVSILFRCLLAGATVALPEPGASSGRSIEELGITHVSLVATQLRRLLREKPETGGLTAILLGGGPAPESLLEEAAGRGLPVRNSYGLTETASQVTATPSETGTGFTDFRTAGRVLDHREVSVSGEGEILVRGKTLFAGYVEGGRVERPLDAEGWFHTGDLGEFDASWNLRVLGRSDNLFISGGENVQPEEIEAALELLNGVERAVVTPVPDAEFGRRPVAFVKMADDAAPPENLAGELEKTLPRFKVPVAFHDWPAHADAGRMKPDRELFRSLASRVHLENQT